MDRITEVEVLIVAVVEAVVVEEGMHTNFTKVVEEEEDNQPKKQPPLSEHVKGHDDKVWEGIECYNCRKWGHYSPDCPSSTVDGKEGAQHLQLGLCMVHCNVTGSEGSKKLHFLEGFLLDMGSSFSGVRLGNHVIKVRKCKNDEVITASTNGGTIVYDEIGELTLFPLTVHVNDSSLANILSLKDLLDVPGLYSTMDSRKEKAIIIHYDGRIFKFVQIPEGLYIFNQEYDSNNVMTMTPSIPDKSKLQVTNYSTFLQTVSTNKPHYSVQEIKGAKDLA